MFGFKRIRFGNLTVFQLRFQRFQNGLFGQVLLQLLQLSLGIDGEGFVFQHLTAILEFMYAGEVNVAQDQLPAFLKTAERLKVKGLAEAPQTIKQE